jgi:heavy metal translocating P-type ATPase
VATTADIRDGAVRDRQVPPPAAGGDDALTASERRDIAVRLGPILAGAGLLGVGVIHGLVFPGQPDVTALIQASAAAVVGVPIAIKGVRGFLSRPAQDLSSQLVTLALLAAMAYGDFVTATLVPLFMELGRLFEERSSRGARAAIEGIRKLSARRATRVENGREVDVAPESLAAGDEVVVRPGEVVPVDGRVVAGHSSVDQAPITGESAYEDVGPGHRVFAGSINLQGLLRVETTRAGANSALGRVVELLREVEGAKTPALRAIDRLAGIYLPAILAVAGVTLFLTGELARAIAVLVVACPSALFLCGPVAMVATMTACTRLSMLVKSASFLEAVPRIKTLVFDKTGTVTVGQLGVESIRPAGPWSEDEVLAAAAACGHGSRHPVSRAALEEAEERGLAHEKPESVSEEAGAGVTARSAAGVLRLGRASWLRAAGLDVPEDGTRGTSGAWVARDDVVLGHLSLVDRPRESAGRALRATRELGVERLVLLTGDRRTVAERVAKELGFDDVVAEVLPEQKLDLVRAEQSRGAPVMMVGDGINDALALSGADVGIAIGARVNEVALGGADIAVMTSDLTRLPILIDVARMTRRIVLQNLLIVAAVALAMIVLASLGIISPLVGAILHNIDALFVVMNSSRLLRLYAPS